MFSINIFEIISVMAKLKFQQSLLSSASHDSSEIILTY